MGSCGAGSVTVLSCIKHVQRISFGGPVFCEPTLIRLQPRTDGMLQLRYFRLEVLPAGLASEVVGRDRDRYAPLRGMDFQSVPLVGLPGRHSRVVSLAAKWGYCWWAVSLKSETSTAV